jgi:transposase
VAQRYLVTLSEDERAHLRALTNKGKVAARTLARAPIRLRADAGVADSAIATALHVGTATVERIGKRFVEEGLDAAMSARPRPGGRRKLQGKPEALRVALACRTPPDERPRWSMQPLPDNLVELNQVESMSAETVRRPLKQPSASRG